MEVSLGSGNDKAIGTATAIGTGLLAWEYAATNKHGYGEGAKNLPEGYGPFSKWRFGDALAGLIGHDNTQKVVSGWGGGADFRPNFGGWLNKFVFAGVGLKIADWIAREVWHGYKTSGLLPEIVGNAANGLIVGGAVGGIFDPEPTAADMNRGSSNSNTGNGSGARQLTFHS